VTKRAPCSIQRFAESGGPEVALGLEEQGYEKYRRAQVA